MWKPIKEFFTHKPSRGTVNVNHEQYLEKNLRRVGKKENTSSYLSGVDPYYTSLSSTSPVEVYIYKGGCAPSSSDQITTTV